VIQERQSEFNSSMGTQHGAKKQNGSQSNRAARSARASEQRRGVGQWACYAQQDLLSGPISQRQ
jgi:hypothetical protein